MKRAPFNYAIAAGHELTANTAVQIIKAGGNIFDAAIAAFMASWIAEPCMSSAGGGGFATVCQANGNSQVFDFFCQTPAFKRPVEEVEFFPVLLDFGSTKEAFHVGRGAVAVPGSVAGIFELHKKLGYMPIRELVLPAMEIARAGVKMSDFQHSNVVLLKPIFNISERSKEIFFIENQVKTTGSLVKMPLLADFLDLIAHEGPSVFYKGEIAKKIVADQKENGGYLTRKDLEEYAVIERSPLTFSLAQHKVLTNPQPSLGGHILMDFLKEGQWNTKKISWLSRSHLRELYRVFQKTTSGKADYDHLVYPGNKESGNNKRGSTTHISILDKQGNAISLTVSNGEGCGYYIENTDIHLNNMLGEAALMPDGFHNWRPYTRLYSMMSPSLVLNQEEKPEMVIGTGGAGRIPYAIAQVLLNRFYFDRSLSEAVNAPRTHLQEGIFNEEPGFDSTNFLPNSQVKRWDKKSLYFGGTQVTALENGILSAVGDERRRGVGLVF